jgi:hypothetical protein
MKYDILELKQKFVYRFQFLLKSDRNNGYLHEDLHAFLRALQECITLFIMAKNVCETLFRDK